MNINAGTNQYNLSLKKMKEEKRPTFATIFDKLDARSKKLNPKNPLNAVMTNDQMYRYYLEETEPMLSEIPDDYDLLDDVIGGKSLKDMKLSEFAKLLSGDLDSDRNVKYETLVATISPTPTAPLIPSMISIASPPTPPPSAPIIPAPSSSVATSIAPPVAVSGLMPSPPTPPPTTAAAAPIIPAPSSSVATSIAAPVAVSGLMPSPPTPPPTPPPTTAAAASAASGSGGSSGTGTGGRGLTISTAPPVAGLTGLLSALSPASLIRAGGSAVSSAISSVVSAKPSPSGSSIPNTAVASAATTMGPTPTPASTISSTPLSPSAAGAAGAVGVSASAVASSLVSKDEGNYNLWFGGTITGTNPLVYNNALKAGLTPPKVPDDIKTTFSSTNLKWVNHIKEMNDYNEKLQRENKDPTGEYSFTFSNKQQSLINALKANGNDAQVVFEGIKDGSIDLKDYEPSKPAASKPAASKPVGGEKGKGKGKKKK